MNKMTVFENPEFGQVRTVEREGEPWFVAADVCRALEIRNSRDAVARLDDDEKNTVVLTNGNRGNPNMSIVNEPGLYSLVLGSRKPEAKAFKRWITHEVIPAIRKRWAYAIPGTQADAALKRADAMLKNAQTRQFNAIMKAASNPRLSAVAAEVFGIAAIEQMTGKEIHYRPPVEETWSATQIGKELGVSANAIGKIANANGLKTDEYGMYVMDKSRYSNKEVPSFRYNEKGKNVLRDMLSRIGEA